MKTLIVKVGALGDVARTTVLLRELKGEIYWLTKRSSGDLLKSDKISKVIFLEEIAKSKILEEKFDLVISLDEEMEILQTLRNVKTKKLIGVYLNGEKIDYTPESKYWFDMSLSSKFGKKKADQLKWDNVKSVPQILIEMIGKKFNGQEYDLGFSAMKTGEKIGLINVVTGVWPNKGWHGYKDLAALLSKEGHETVFLEMKKTLREHIDEINSCSLIVCGDTLGMHIALALKKKVVTIFNCTSPQEIYDYGRMVKIVSPLLQKYFYDKRYSVEAVNAISLKEVHKAVKEMLKK